MVRRVIGVVRRAVRVLVGGIAALAVLSVLQVLAVRWFTPPATLTMLSRSWENGSGFDVRGLPLDQLGSAGPRAFVASEDGLFFVHGGLDWASLCDVVGDAASGGRLRGASTISQQTAKNLFLWQGRSWVRKALELWYTVWLELLVPKERILELYLTVAETGDGVFGLEAGARHHFGVPAASLTEQQAGRLAGILPSPRTRSVTGQAAKERGRWLRRNRVPFPGDPGFETLQRHYADGGWGPCRCWH